MDENEALDPFAPENIHQVQLIVQLRIYDVLMALLTNIDKEAAAGLLELHSQGNIIGTAPSFLGQFVTDIINDLG